jgi:hypothetical protein
LFLKPTDEVSATTPAGSRSESQGGEYPDADGLAPALTTVQEHL